MARYSLMPEDVIEIKRLREQGLIYFAIGKK